MGNGNEIHWSGASRGGKMEAALSLPHYKARRIRAVPKGGPRNLWRTYSPQRYR